jgi:SET and MYND domain-containing protein
MDIKDTDNETDDDFKPSPREAFHTDPQLCGDMLRKVVSTVPLKIRSSQISMGSGLFTAAAVEEGREIYQSTPLMTAVDAGNETFCHYCLKDTGDAAWTTTPISPAKACMGCKVARFCSKVRDWANNAKIRTSPNGFVFLGMSKGSLV